MNDKIIDALNWRYATKKYDSSKMVAESDLNTILEAGRLAPHSFGIDGYKMIVVSNPEVKARLMPAAYGQPQLVDAPHIVVLARRTDGAGPLKQELVEHTAKVRNVEIDSLSSFSEMLDMSVTHDETLLANWLTSQVYINLGFMLEAAAQLGVDTTPMEGFDRAQFDEILGLKDMNLASVVVLAIGHRSDDDQYASYPKVRRSAEDAIVRV